MMKKLAIAIAVLSTTLMANPLPNTKKKHPSRPIPAKPCIAAPIISQDKISAIQKLINQYRLQYRIPGISVSFMFPSSHRVLTLTSGLKNIKSKQPITANTLFQIGSITKVYTAILVHQLMSKDKISLMQPISFWLPQYKKWGHITIKQLLNMHSGIPGYWENKLFQAAVEKNPTKAWSSSEVLAYVYRAPLLYKPGTHFNYSDSNYIILSMIIEKASGQSFASLLKQNIISSLNLKHTFYITRSYSKNELNRMATGYDQANQDIMAINMSQAGAAGAMVATTKDTALFFNAIFTGHLLNKKQLKIMLTPYSTSSGQQMNANNNMFEAFALGIDQNWYPHLGLVWNKPGGTYGFFSSANYSVKHHIIIVIAANKWVPSAFMNRKFIPMLYRHLLKLSPQIIR